MSWKMAAKDKKWGQEEVTNKVFVVCFVLHKQLLKKDRTTRCLCMDLIFIIVWILTLKKKTNIISCHNIKMYIPSGIQLTLHTSFGNSCVRFYSVLLSFCKLHVYLALRVFLSASNQLSCCKRMEGEPPNLVKMDAWGLAATPGLTMNCGKAGGRRTCESEEATLVGSLVHKHLLRSHATILASKRSVLVITHLKKKNLCEDSNHKTDTLRGL